MVYGRYNYSYIMGFIYQLITGGHHPVVDSPFKPRYSQLWSIFDGSSTYFGAWTPPIQLNPSFRQWNAR